MIVDRCSWCGSQCIGVKITEEGTIYRAKGREQLKRDNYGSKEPRTSPKEI